MCTLKCRREKQQSETNTSLYSNYGWLLMDLICLVITKAESNTCQCEYLLKADTQIKSHCFNICCWFESLIKSCDKSIQHLTIFSHFIQCHPCYRKCLLSLQVSNGWSRRQPHHWYQDQCSALTGRFPFSPRHN